MDDHALTTSGEPKGTHVLGLLSFSIMRTNLKELFVILGNQLMRTCVGVWGSRININRGKISFGGIPNSRNVLFLQISSVLRSQALETLCWTCWTWPGPAPKIPKTFSGTFSAPSPEPVEPDLALHQGFRNLLLNPVEPDRALHQSLTDLLRNLLRNPVELDLALHQSLPGLLRNLLRNPVEPDMALLQCLPDLLLAAPKPPRPSPEPVEPDLALRQSFPDLLRNLLRNWLCIKASRNLLWNFLWNPVELDPALHQSLPEPSPERSPEPSLEPCWTWPGSAPKPPRPSSEPSSEPCWTWPGSASKPPRPSPEPSPEPCWTWPGSASKLPRPSPEPCWTWHGFAPKHPRPSPEPSLEPCLLNLTCTKASQSFSGTVGTFSGTSLNLTCFCTSSHRGVDDPISLRCWGKMLMKQWVSIFQGSMP